MPIAFTYRLLSVCTFFAATFVYAQDTLILIDNTIVECKVLEIKFNSIDYRKLGTPPNEIFNINKGLVQYIRYNSGAIDTVNPVTKSETLYRDSLSSGVDTGNGKKGYEAGFVDGFNEYHDMGPAAYSGLAGGCLNVTGIFMPIIYSASKMNASIIANPSYVKSKDQDYRNGYLNGANKKRRNKAWAGYGIGLGTYVAVTIGFVMLLSF